MTDFTVSTSAEAAAWLATDEHAPLRYDVRGIVGADFPRYARVFHPAEESDGDDVRPIRWRDVAAANRTVMHPAAEWGSLVGSWRLQGQADVWHGGPSVGSLPRSVATALAAVLAPDGRQDEKCWFAVWEGYGGLADRWRRAATFTVPGRRMHLLSGRLHAAHQTTSDAILAHQSVNLWWPESREWCVATDIDLMTTYVGGSAELIARIVASHDLEALDVPPTQGVTRDSDTVNPLPASPH